MIGIEQRKIDTNEMILKGIIWVKEVSRALKNLGSNVMKYLNPKYLLTNDLDALKVSRSEHVSTATLVNRLTMVS
jgi:hypothetical protein